MRLQSCAKITDTLHLWTIVLVWWGCTARQVGSLLTVCTWYSQSAKIRGLIRGRGAHTECVTAVSQASWLCLPWQGETDWARYYYDFVVPWTSIKMTGHRGITQNVKRWLSFEDFTGYGTFEGIADMLIDNFSSTSSNLFLLCLNNRKERKGSRRL